MLLVMFNSQNRPVAFGNTYDETVLNYHNATGLLFEDIHELLEAGKLFLEFECADWEIVDSLLRAGFTQCTDFDGREYYCRDSMEITKNCDGDFYIDYAEEF